VENTSKTKQQLLRENEAFSAKIDDLKNEVALLQKGFHNVVEQHVDGILIIDSSGSILFVNHAVELMFGRSQNELIGVLFGFPMIQDEFFEIDIISKNGVEGIGEIRVGEIEWEEKPASLVSIRDITIHKQAEEELIRAKEIAEQADRLKSAFLNNLSHEIRTPMNAILGFSAFITDPDLLPEDRADYSGHITSGCTNLLGIIDNLVDLAVIESEGLEPNISECRINIFLESIKDEFLEQEQHHMENILFTLSPANTEDEFTILIDQARLKQVLNNLLKNAIKFTEYGFIEFGYTLGKPGVVEFFIHDSGTGIPADKLHSIFDRFIKLEEFHTRRYSGTGVGLTISKKLVEFLGGAIRVESTVGEGSLFTVSLPLSLPEPDTITSSTKPEQLKGVAIDWTGKRILVAEDTESNFQLIEYLLKKTNVEILWAKNGKEAVEKCTNGVKIDLILMDIQMPVMDGFTATEQILKMGKQIPIIAQTAYALSHEKEEIMEAGFSDLLTKPIHASDLMEKISQVFEKSSNI